MMFPLLPTWQATAVTALTPEFLKKQNIRLLMLDFDNTIVPYTTDTPSPAVESWLHQLPNWGICVCVVSNSKKPRVVEFCKKYGIDCITHAKKPFSRGIKACLDRYGAPPEQAVLVGDQIYTDTLGGGCVGVKTVLVEAIHNHTVWLKLRHIAEMPFILASKNRRISL